MPIDQFAKEMQELAAQAALVPPAELGPMDLPENSDLAHAVGKALRPLAEGLETVSRGVAESNRVLARLAKEIEPAAGEAGAEDPAERITRTLEAIQAQVQRMGQVESANLRLFDALHAELKARWTGASVSRPPESSARSCSPGPRRRASPPPSTGS